MPLRELVQPDVRALRHDDGAGHPGLVLGEALRFHVQSSEVGRLDGAARAGAAMEAKPQRALVLGRDVDAGHEPVQQGREAVAERRGQERPPAGPDPAKLPAQAGRLGQRGRAQHRHQVLVVRPERRPAGEEAAELVDHGPVARGGRQVGVVEQLPEWIGGRVRVGEPAVDHLLERDLAVGRPVGLAREVRAHGQLAAVDGERREALGEPGEGRVRRVRADELVEVVERVVDRLRILLLAIDPHHGVQNLVDQAEGVELARADDRVGQPVGTSPGGHLRGQAANGTQVRQDHVAGQLEQRLVQAIADACVRRDVELAPAHGVTGIPNRRISLIGAWVVGLPVAAVFLAGYQSTIVIRSRVTPTTPSCDGMSTRWDPSTSTSLSGMAISLSKRIVTLRGRSLPK